MTKKLVTMIIATLALVGSFAAAAAPAAAAPKTPVRAGNDGCGFNVWVNDEQLIYYLHCGPDWD